MDPDTRGGCTCRYSHGPLYMLMHKHACVFSRAKKKKRERRRPPTLRCSACQSQMFTRLSPTALQHVLPRNVFFARIHKRIYEAQSRIHSEASGVFIVSRPHVHTSALHISQLITSPHAALSHSVTYQTVTQVHRDALLSLLRRTWEQRSITPSGTDVSVDHGFSRCWVNR